LIPKPHTYAKWHAAPSCSQYVAIDPDAPSIDESSPKTATLTSESKSTLWSNTDQPPAHAPAANGYEPFIKVDSISFSAC